MHVRSHPILPVSVLIPTFNRAQMLARALRSVASQRPRRPAEVIVIDDGSTDGSYEVAELWGARVIRHERNLGASAAKQTGLLAARHDWVALLDSDDEWLPDHLGIIWPLTPGHVLVASSCMACDPSSSERRFHGAVSGETTIITSPAPLIHPENPIPDSGAMVQRDVALAAGGFRDGLCEDLDIWCRVLSRGHAAVSPQVGMLYHIHPGQLSSDWEAIHDAHLHIARSHSAERWWSPGLVERRMGVTAWDRFRTQRRDGSRDALRTFLTGLLAHPQRIRGVLEVCRHRVAVRRRASRLGRSGAPSVAVLAGCDPKLIPEGDRYEVDLSAARPAAAFRRLLWRPSAVALVSSHPQAALARLAGIRPVRPAELEREPAPPKAEGSRSIHSSRAASA